MYNYVDLAEKLSLDDLTVLHELMDLKQELKQEVPKDGSFET